MSTNVRPLATASVVLGIGLGGFFDGILFHQILQTHAMLTGWIPKTSIANIEINMFWDGLFHAVTWTTTVIGVGMLFRAARLPDVPWSERILVGGGLLGWGLFNLVEGVIDHHLLGVHHVYENAGLSIWDWLFLGSGALLIAAGSAMIRTGSREAPARTA
jgi:uncharacterized membrane protein